MMWIRKWIYNIKHININSYTKEMGKRKPESQLTLADLEEEENENQGE